MFFWRRMCLFCFLILIIIPNNTYALAGWGEFDNMYYYAPHIIIAHGHPSDMCPKLDKNISQTCLKIYKEDDYSASYGFKNLDLLVSVNLPKSDDFKFIIGKSYEDSNWIIYDVENDQVMERNEDYDLVLAEWENMGNEKPKILKMNHVDDYFEETEESKELNDERSEFGRAIFATFALILIIPIASVLLIIFAINSGRALLKKYK